MAVLIDNHSKRRKIDPKIIRLKAQAVLDALGNPDAELSILLVEDAEIAELNEQYLNRRGPMRAGQFTGISPELLGDVVISVETAEREGNLSGTGIEKRIDELLIHGVLHLFGYDHETNVEDHRVMESKSVELLQIIARLDR